MNSNSRIYTVDFRISGADVRPDQISSDLGLVPSQTRYAGEPKGKVDFFTDGLWAYSISNEKLGRNEWWSLEEGLSSALKVLTEKRGNILAYAKRFDVYWWCAQFQSSFDGGFTLSADLLRDLSSFGVELRLETYWSDG